MIRIRENDLPDSVKVSQLDKNIGAVDSNNVETRVFVFDKIFKGLDLSSDKYIVTAQIQIAEKEPFYVPLRRKIFENEVHYILGITREICSVIGLLSLNLSIKSVSKRLDINYFSYIMQFNVLPNINANKSIEKIDRDIFEQYIIQTAAHAQNASVEADKAQQIVDNVNFQIGDLNELNTDNKETIVDAINELKQYIDYFKIILNL